MQPETRKQVLNRLRRIEGQVRGLALMVEKETYCIDIMTQSNAVKKALTGVEDLLLVNHLTTHVVEQMKGGKEKKAIEEIAKVYKLASHK